MNDFDDLHIINKYQVFSNGRSDKLKEKDIFNPQIIILKSSSENKLSSSENKLSLSENKLSLSENKLSSSENKLSSSENKLSSSENKLSSHVIF